MDAGACEPAEILGERIHQDDAARRAWSVEVDAATLAYVDACLDARRDAIAAFHGRELKGREGAGFLRYGPGGFYRPHRDRGILESWPGAARRRISVVVFLSGAAGGGTPGPFTGGELRVFDDRGGEPLTVVPRQGCLVAFDSTLLHEVVPVVGGTRDVIVDWFY